MKVNLPTNNCTVSAPNTPQVLQVDLNANSFRAMTSTLYSFKERAVIRETSTNAYDAQVDSGKANEPFLVHLPNKLAPYFSVRDYGTGIPNEEMIPRYTTLFRSSRMLSNDHVGTYGLGSKAPLCKTDGFSVTNFRDGVKYIYSIYLNEQKCPACVLLSESDTDEPNGLEVSVPVEQCDIEKYVREAAYVYRWFKTRPIITGAKCEIPDIKVIYQGQDWQLCVLSYF
jgi:DNA topoisomerase VI subunit B